MQHPRTLELILSACYPPDCVLTAGCRHTRLTEHLLDRPAELQMLVCVCVWLIRLCVGFYKRKMDWLKKKKEKEMYVWARKRENDMLMSAYCMNKRAGNVCMYVWNANVSALSVFLFVCAHELTDDDIQYSTAAHVIIGPALHTFALIKQLPICIHSNLNFASLGLTKQWRAVKTKKEQLS